MKYVKIVPELFMHSAEKQAVFSVIPRRSNSLIESNAKIKTR